MADRRYYWLKLKKDFFEEKTVKLLSKHNPIMALAYLKMLTAATDTEGVLEFYGLYDSLEEEVAEVIDMPLEVVEKTIAFLIRSELASREGDRLILYYAIANIGSESQAAERMRRMRERNNVTLEPESERNRGRNNVTLERNGVTAEQEERNIVTLERNGERNIVTEKRNSVTFERNNVTRDRDRDRDRDRTIVTTPSVSLEKDINSNSFACLPVTRSEVREEFNRAGVEPSETTLDNFMRKVDGFSDWRAVVRAWARNEAPKPVNPVLNYQQHEATEEAYADCFMTFDDDEQ